MQLVLFRKSTRGQCNLKKIPFSRSASKLKLFTFFHMMNDDVDDDDDLSAAHSSMQIQHHQ